MDGSMDITNENEHQASSHASNRGEIMEVDEADAGSDRVDLKEAFKELDCLRQEMVQNCAFVNQKYIELLVAFGYDEKPHQSKSPAEVILNDVPNESVDLLRVAPEAMGDGSEQPLVEVSPLVCDTSTCSITTEQASGSLHQPNSSLVERQSDEYFLDDRLAAIREQVIECIKARQADNKVNDLQCELLKEHGGRELDVQFMLKPTDIRSANDAGELIREEEMYIVYEDDVGKARKYTCRLCFPNPNGRLYFRSLDFLMFHRNDYAGSFHMPVCGLMEKARDFFTLPMLRRYCGRDGFAQSREQDSSSKACWFCNVNYNEPDAAHAQSLEHRLVLLLAARGPEEDLSNLN